MPSRRDSGTGHPDVIRVTSLCERCAALASTPWLWGRRSRRVWPSMLLALCGLSMSSVCDRLEAESVSEEWWVGGAPSPIP